MNKKEKKLRKDYKKELNRPILPNAKEILARNENTFVYVMKSTEQIVKIINNSKDFEFQLAMCNNLSELFKNMALNIAISKVDQRKIGRVQDYTDRMIG